MGLVVVVTLGLGCRVEKGPMHAGNPAGRWVTVGPGETVQLIAARAGVPVEDILELNGIEKAEDVTVGRTIFVIEAQHPAEAALPPMTMATLDSGPRPGLRWPLANARVGSPFGVRDGRPHEGIDLPAPVGTPVFAAADGLVAYAGNRVRGYGNMVVLKHSGNLLTVYAHNSIVLVTQGQPVRAGDRIALVGQSGRATGPHLHFEVRAGQIPQDPMPLLVESVR